jgi:hypothetical protein
MESLLIALLCLVVFIAVGVGALYLMLWAAVTGLIVVLMVLEAICTSMFSSRQVDVTIRQEKVGPPPSQQRVTDNSYRSERSWRGRALR